MSILNALKLQVQTHSMMKTLDMEHFIAMDKRNSVGGKARVVAPRERAAA